MHRYLKSVGFKDIYNAEYRVLLSNVESKPDNQIIELDFDDDKIIENVKEYTFMTGICTIGRLDEEKGYIREYSYPFFKGSELSSTEDVEIIKSSDNECYQGVIEDNRIGIDLVFFINDSISKRRKVYKKNKKVDTKSVKLSGLAGSGKILFQLTDTKINVKEEVLDNSREELYKSARKGDADAAEELSSKDFETYNILQERIKSEDTMTILQSYIMPIGIECDKYEILGTIQKHLTLQNPVTDQILHVLTVVCSGISIDVIINEKDLIGEIELGRRFKGDIWLQGHMY